MNTAPAVNNNVHYVNQPVNLPQQTTVPALNHPQHQLNHSLNPPQQQQPQTRFFIVQPTVSPRVPNPSTTMINNQPTLLNQPVRLPDPQKFNQRTI